MRGGIPDRDISALNRYWDEIPGVRTALFKKGDRAGYTQLSVPAAEIKATIIYQHLMDYWAETMQDDWYLIVADGWKAGAKPREIQQVKGKGWQTCLAREGRLQKGCSRAGCG